jgi:ribosomal protein S8
MSAFKTDTKKERKNVCPKSDGEILPMSPSHLSNPSIRSKTAAIEIWTWKMKQQKKCNRILKQTGLIFMAQYLREKSTAKREGTKIRMNPKKETATRATKRTRDLVNSPKSKQWRPNKALPQLYQW